MPFSCGRGQAIICDLPHCHIRTSHPTTKSGGTRHNAHAPGFAPLDSSRWMFRRESKQVEMFRNDSGLGVRMESIANLPGSRVDYAGFDCFAVQSSEGRFFAAQKSGTSRAVTRLAPVPQKPIGMAFMDVLCARVSRLKYRAFLALHSCAQFSTGFFGVRSRAYWLGTKRSAGDEPSE